MTAGSGPARNVAVVICTRDRPAALERCLDALQQIRDRGISIVVVDSAPSSSAAKAIADRYRVEYTVSPVKGLSRARNVGTRATRAEIVAYLDDDMVPHAGWLDSLIGEFSDPAVMAVTGPVLGLELTEASRVDLWLALELNCFGPRRFQVDRSTRQWFERANFGGVGDGNFALRRSAFEQIGGFDERLGRGVTIDTSEEHYAFFRVVERGFKIAYVPEAIVFHPTAPITRKIVRDQMAGAAAFLVFLAWNHPSQSWRLAKFAVRAAFPLPRWWRMPLRRGATALSAAEKLLSAVSGLRIFARSLRQDAGAIPQGNVPRIGLRNVRVPISGRKEAGSRPA